MSLSLEKVCKTLLYEKPALLVPTDIFFLFMKPIGNKFFYETRL